MLTRGSRRETSGDVSWPTGEQGGLLIGFPEVLGVRGDVIYRMSDAGGAPSFMKKYHCPGR